MMTVHEVSRLTGISIRTLQYYDNIGLLSPSGRSGSGYRLYDDKNLELLQQILLFRELEFPLKEIKQIIKSSDYDKTGALKQQIKLLELRREHIDGLLDLAVKSLNKEGDIMDFKAFDNSKLEQYAAEARKSWGGTKEYKEFEEKNISAEEHKELAGRMMAIFAEFGAVKDGAPDSAEAAAIVKKLQDFISAHYYKCSDEVLAGLGKMYGSGGDFTSNINAAAGDGIAEFASKAIEAYCRK